MKIGIIGYGFVGSALHNALKKNVKVFLVDPKLQSSINDLNAFNPSIVFVCVPTPMSDDGTQDISILDNVIKEIISLEINPLIAIKSTILPDVLDYLKLQLTNVVYNPEFLREKHANEDFIKSNLIVLGGKANDVDELDNFYKEHTICECKEYIKTDLITASFIKYTINTFLATKITFFNELKNIFDISNADDSWENFTNYLKKDTRIGSSHMSVPGHDGKLGFGGACLPKDSRALLEYARKHGAELSILNEAINVNNNIRRRYNIEQRESDQNINFLNKNK